MKNFIKCFSIILFTTLFAFLLSSKQTSAIYDESKNTIGVSVTADSVKVTVKYQRGIDVATAKYFWCDIGTNPPEAFDDPTDCKGEVREVNYIQSSEYSSMNFTSESPAENADSNLTSYTFTISKESDPVLNNMSTLIEGGSKNYIIFAQANFCARRNVGADNSVGSCAYYDDIKYASKVVDLVNIDRNHNLDFSGEISNSGLADIMDKIAGIVKGTVLPVIWVVLGLFLIVKGALLGVQIVKAADEPQVRQEKIGSLKWLVIGVAIAYGSTGIVTVIMNFFDGTF